MNCKNTTDIKGVLTQQKASKNYFLARKLPTPALAPFIEQYWRVDWELVEHTKHLQQNIPTPNVNIYFELSPQVKKTVRCAGVSSELFNYTMQDKGCIVGIKFLAGGFNSFSDIEPKTLLNRVVALDDILPNEAPPNLTIAQPFHQQISQIEAWLLNFKPKIDTNIQLIELIFKRIANTDTITKVADLASEFSMSERQLQRLFKEYVGLSPKWVIKKYRLQEVLYLMERGECDVQSIITQLGYFDQAHLIKDFKSILGLTPQTYQQKL